MRVYILERAGPFWEVGTVAQLFFSAQPAWRCAPNDNLTICLSQTHAYNMDMYIYLSIYSLWETSQSAFRA